MSDAGSAKPKGDGEELNVLRAKYHDYCSAQLADLLLFLSSDEIFLIAQKAARGAPEGLNDLSYTGMVRMATAWLAERVSLPPFDVWLEDYRAHPDRYEEYFMGLWEAEAGAKVTEEPH
ncbi:MAG TPA: hypothetical protein VE173_07725 [Longimicrobiales bacterium]|nr:hypothetical protein [Longimicrobiales bacterium]